MKKTKNKLISLLLTLVMVVGMIPTLFATPAYAAETWVDVNSASALQTAITNAPANVKTNIRLTANLSGHNIKIPYDKNLVIDLNGYSVSCNTSGKGLFQIYRCPNVTIMNSSSTTSNLTGYGANALRLYNTEDGYGGQIQTWCAVHLRGKIAITQTYVAGGTALYVDTPDINLGSLSIKSGGTCRCLVNFDANGGTNKPDALYQYIWSNLALPTDAPTCSGYTLKGWNTAANGLGTDWGFIYRGNVGATLYAQWSQNQYLTYNANGHGTAPSTFTKTYNVATNAADAISATGYTFNGWNTKADGTGTSYVAGEEIKAANVDPTATTLYAQWTENTATLTYDANGHGTAPNAVTMKYSQATNAANAITAEGYTFTGWNTEADGKGTSYAAGAEVKAANADPAETTLYAQWAEIIKKPKPIEEPKGISNVRYYESYYTDESGEQIGIGDPKEVTITDWHLITETCDSYEGNGGLMGHQYYQNSTEIGRTIIGLTEEMLKEITSGGKNLVIVGGDKNAQTTLSIDCAYTYFYNGDQKIEAGKGGLEGIAAFVIIENNDKKESISGYGYYRIYNGDEDHFMFDVMFKNPNN